MKALFLLPVKALSPIFRAKFLHELQKSPLANTIPSAVWKQDWVVHCQPVGNGRTALKYLAPYIFRVAISNRRLVKLDATRDQVTFHYRTSDTGETKFCTLSTDEFIHRFLQHVLPRGFVKVRYFGFFAHSNRQRLPALRQRLIQLYPENNPSGQDQPDQKPAPFSPIQVLSCPICGQPMRRLYTIRPTGRCPPR